MNLPITFERQQHTVIKDWGYETWFANSPLYCGKMLFIKKGYSSSLHFHAKKTETIVVTKGQLSLILLKDEEEIWTELYEDCSVLITPGLVHRLYARDTDVILHEFSTEHFDSDSFRIAPGFTPSNKNQPS